MASITVRTRGELTRRQTDPVNAGGQAGYRRNSDTPKADNTPTGYVNNFVGWIFGEDQNTPPNVAADTEKVKADLNHRLQAVSSQLDVLQHRDPQGLHQENRDMKNRIEELEREQRELRGQLEKADAKKFQRASQRAGPTPRAHDITRRE